MNRVEYDKSANVAEHATGRFYVEKDGGEIYILATSESGMVGLVCLSDGNTWSGFHPVPHCREITDAEFLTIAHGETFTRITSPITITPGE